MIVTTVYMTNLLVKLTRKNPLGVPWGGLPHTEPRARSGGDAVPPPEGAGRLQRLGGRGGRPRALPRPTSRLPSPSGPTEPTPLPGRVVIDVLPILTDFYRSFTDFYGLSCENRVSSDDLVVGR